MFQLFSKALRTASKHSFPSPRNKQESPLKSLAHFLIVAGITHLLTRKRTYKTTHTKGRIFPFLKSPSSFKGFSKGKSGGGGATSKW